MAIGSNSIIDPENKNRLPDPDSLLDHLHFVRVYRPSRMEIAMDGGTENEFLKKSITRWS